MGDRGERSIVNSLHSCGFATLKAPGSGSATKRELPDVIAGRAVENHDFGDPISFSLHIEEKTQSGTSIRFDEEEVEDLQFFANRFGGIAVLSAKFKKRGVRTPFYMLKPEDCHRTPSGNYSIRQKDAEERAYILLYPETNAKEARLEMVDS